MKLNTVNRQGDKWPVLELTAENDREGRRLRKLMKDFGAIQKAGIEFGVATGGWPPCGNVTHHYACDSISVRVLLGQGG